MNKRIKELLKQSGLQAYYDAQDGQIEKFAELVWKDGYKEGMSNMFHKNLSRPDYVEAIDAYYESEWSKDE
jgi:hypothetical protein